MKRPRVRSAIATLFLLGLTLIMATSGLAQTRTPTPAPIADTPTPPPTAAPGEAEEPEAEAPPEAAAQEVQPGIELTVYNQNVGLVKEVRALDLEAGDNVVRFTWSTAAGCCSVTSTRRSPYAPPMARPSAAPSSRAPTT